MFRKYKNILKKNMKGKHRTIKKRRNVVPMRLIRIDKGQYLIYMNSEKHLRLPIQIKAYRVTNLHVWPCTVGSTQLQFPYMFPVLYCTAVHPNACTNLLHKLVFHIIYVLWFTTCI